MKKIITIGEIMMRLSPPNYQKIAQTQSFDAVFGGSEANIGISLAHLGLSVAHITALPDNDLGYAVQAHLRKYGVETTFIQLNPGRLGLFFCEAGAVMRPTKIIYDRYDSAFDKVAKDSFDWEEIFKDAQWFHWSGITPALSENCAYECLKAVKTAQKMGLTVSGDIYFRSGLWNYGKTPQTILPELVANTQIVLCDEAAMELYLDIDNQGFSKNFAEAAQQLMAKFPKIQKVVDTQRVSISASHNQISASLWNGKELLQTAMQDITHIVDRIGAGDAFFAGLIYGLLTYQDDQKALEFGNCASALKHTIVGDINLSSVADIERLMQGDKSGRIRR
ncbi:MAG: sugar kinase [Microscillaceae bacterium]|nr:sugar kinase [Microscillaceae bacterium]